MSQQSGRASPADTDSVSATQKDRLGNREPVGCRALASTRAPGRVQGEVT